MDEVRLNQFIASTLEDILRQAGHPIPQLNDNTVIFGKDGLLDSMMLVEFMLSLEDYCEEEGYIFKWDDDAMMSEKHSIYNSLASLRSFILNMPSQK